MSPYSAFGGKSGSPLPWRRGPTSGSRCSRSVGLVSKFRQLAGADSPQPYCTYSFIRVSLVCQCVDAEARTRGAREKGSSGLRLLGKSLQHGGHGESAEDTEETL